MIVKEKFAAVDDARPVAYAAMIKREAGYDSGHGDWEYVYADLSSDKPPTRGRIASCIQCHKVVAKRDYVFGKHLRDTQPPPAITSNAAPQATAKN